jgi:hypothetical protein
MSLPTSGTVTQACFFDFSGLAPQGNYDPTALGKISLCTLIRAFLDGGQYSGAAHINQLPLVKVYVNSPNASYPYGSPAYSVAMTLTSPVTTSTGPIANIWYRYPGINSPTGNFYTEEYPNATGPLTGSTYAETVAGQPMSLAVNWKYSKDSGGVTWFNMSDDSQTMAGVLDTASGHSTTVTSASPILYTWDVSNGTNFPNGNYWIRGEVYRPGNPLHYSYHELNIGIHR